MAMEMALRRMGHDAITVHGFRSTFRDWAAEQTSFPREIAEMCLAHLVGSEVERAYRRSELLAKRRELLTAWADYCASGVRASRATFWVRLTMLSTFFQSRACGLQSPHILALRACGGVPPPAR